MQFCAEYCVQLYVKSEINQQTQLDTVGRCLLLLLKVQEKTEMDMIKIGKDSASKRIDEYEISLFLRGKKTLIILR